jgi:hypothetical protein
VSGIVTEVNSLRALFEFFGRKAKVIGAVGGIGAVIARGMSEFSAQVICADIDEVVWLWPMTPSTDCWQDWGPRISIGHTPLAIGSKSARSSSIVME